MIAKGQSIEARLARLKEGCCPIHGLGMNQESEWYPTPTPEGMVTTIGCPRKDCPVMAITTKHCGPAILLPHLRYLLIDTEVFDEDYFQEKLDRGMVAAIVFRAKQGA